MVAPSPLAPRTPQQSPPPPPQMSPGLKGLGRRVSQSKPLRMLKTIASKTSLRGHSRRASASSVHSTHSTYSVLSQEEPAEARREGTYEKGVVAAQTPRAEAAPMLLVPESVPQESEQGEQEEQARPTGEAEVHEAEVRPQAVEEPKAELEPETQAEPTQPEAAQEAEEPDVKLALPVPDVTEAVTVKSSDAASKSGSVERKPEEAGHVDTQTAGNTTDTRAVAAEADGFSLSSSSTTVDLPAPVPASVVILDTEGKPAKMTDINPFVVDDPEESLSESSESGSEQVAAAPVEESSPVKSATPLAESVALSQTDSAPSPPAASPHDSPAELSSAPVNDAISVKSPSLPHAPSPAAVSEESAEEEAPELLIPTLTFTTLFLPVPNTDPLTALLIKHVPEPHLRPPRDLSGDWQHTDFHTLVMTNNWRALARMARDRIVSANPRDVELILNLWYIRLSSLARLRLFNQTAAECENVFSVLATVEPPPARAYLFSRVLPFELEVLRAHCAYWAGDHVGYLDDVAALLRRCRTRARAARDPAELSMWKERGARMALIVASQLVEMKDCAAAAALLEPLCASGAQPPAPALRSALARVYLQCGNLPAAAVHFAAVDADDTAEPALKSVNAVVRVAAEGDWAAAAARARALAEGEPENVVAVNNYAVALLGSGKVKEGIQVLESALQASPSATATAEPYLFNLSTMYELRASLAAHKKRDLLIEVAKWSGDGLRTACLKMNT
ncbi:hypothetical protein M0805_006699 [Coniferiporia weirii]|nr:hypothetical protein M0805_006699 [Coniferiporia weirii]